MTDNILKGIPLVERLPCIEDTGPYENLYMFDIINRRWELVRLDIALRPFISLSYSHWIAYRDMPTPPEEEIGEALALLSKGKPRW